MNGKLLIAGIVILTGLISPACRKSEKQKAEQDAGQLAPPSKPRPAPDLEGELFQVPLGDSKPFGPADALVTAVFFGDFTDKKSARLYGDLKRLGRERPGEFRWVFKNFPRYPKPELAMQAACLAVLAGDAGRLDPFLQGLFENPKALTRTALAGIAGKAGLPVEQLEKALGDESLRKRVIGDRRLAVRLGVRHAPAVFLNGRRFAITSFQDLLSRFEQEKKQAQSMVDRGVSPDKLYQELTRRGRLSAWLPKQPTLKPFSNRSLKETGQTPAAGADQKVDVQPGSGPGLGSKNAPVQLVIFADLECTFCAQMIAKLRGLQGQYPKSLRISLRQLPARRRKEFRDFEVALVAAAGQKNAWSLVEKIYANHAGLERPQVLAWAGELGLDRAAIKKHLEQPADMDKVLQSNLAEAKRVGVRGRPYLFVQGRRIPGAAPLSTLKRMIEEALQKKP